MFPVMIDLKPIVKNFEREGYAFIPNFVSDEELALLKAECDKYTEQVDLSETLKHLFDNSANDSYFIDSGDKVRLFYDGNAFDKTTGKLITDARFCINKVGHALHVFNEVCKQTTFSDNVKNLLREIGFVDPAIVQSMFIYKNPKVGSPVPPHQDATYLFTEPEPRLVGFWIPLEDATLENGCLSFIPGSHRWSHLPDRRYLRTYDESGSLAMTYNMPEHEYPSTDFVPLPMPRGSCVLIDGLVVHKSPHNYSDNGRPVYTFHAIDRYKTKWSPLNWLQPTEQVAFAAVFG